MTFFFATKNYMTYDYKLALGPKIAIFGPFVLTCATFTTKKVLLLGISIHC
jgi:hypothetical protein